MIKRRATTTTNPVTLGIVLSLVTCAGLGLILAFYGEMHVDEGYYHLTADLVCRGQIPYRDFLWVQPPLYPYVYAAVFSVAGSSLLTARLTGLVLTLLSMLLMLRIADRSGGKIAALLAAGLICWNPFQIYYTIIVKLYALSLFLFLVAIDGLARQSLQPRHVIQTSLALALGTLTRITMLPGLVLFLVALAWYKKSRRMLIVTIPALLLLITFLALHLFAAPASFRYGIFDYHTAKEAFSPARQLVYKADVLQRLAERYFLLIMLLTTIGAEHLVGFMRARKTQHSTSVKAPEPNGRRLAWWVVGVVAAVHFSSQVPYAYRYMVLVAPAGAALAAACMAKLINEFRPELRRAFLTMFLVACIGTTAARGRANIAPCAGMRTSVISCLRQAALDVSRLTPPGMPIMTPNNSIAVAAGRNVLPGDEMNVLSYHPEWNEARCRKYHILNAAMVERAIRNRQLGAIMVSEHSFIGNFPVLYNPGEEGARPRLMKAIIENYRLVKSYPHLAYFNRTLELYLPVRDPDNQVEDCSSARSPGSALFIPPDRSQPSTLY